ncbi:NXPE family member 3-like [Bombina bombina]|uniref:NXPE family member 3-like n=1 Tax=Bombina bombina TaxID=8345 RepID=UPI00235B0741|nr:NXPE family member 3-like [Bombina bombina]
MKNKFKDRGYHDKNLGSTVNELIALTQEEALRKNAKDGTEEKKCTFVTTYTPDKWQVPAIHRNNWETVKSDPQLPLTKYEAPRVGFVKIKPQVKLHPPPPKAHVLLSTSLPRSTSPSSNSQELKDLLELIEWPAPPSPTSFEFSTSPLTTDYHLLWPRATYYVGEHVEVLITARDHQGQKKTYGGDYFQAKLHSPRLKAGVTGSITDHRNGSYTVSFLLAWPGEVQISIILIHSSEAIAILKEKRETRPDKVYFHGYFEHNGSQEVMECNVVPPSKEVCEYQDRGTGERWYCVRPAQLPCSGYLEHSAGGSRQILTSAEEPLLMGSVKEKVISSKVKLFNVLPRNNSFDDRGLCRPGLSNPEPSGFYYEDAWHSRVCRNKQFSHPSNVTACLAEKVVYMFGDSTLRQWWEYLVEFVPSLQRLDLRVSYAPGPLLATDTQHDYLIEWRAHQRPLSMKRTRLQELRYVANELDGMGGGNEGLVIVINCLAHFVTFPVIVYVNRIRTIRDAVIRLLERSPQTKVLIKSGNTGYLYAHGSDWLSLQLDTVLRAMFTGLPVTILDAWQMTSCHYLSKSIHPGKAIIKNEVELMLSFICPQ